MTLSRRSARLLLWAIVAFSLLASSWFASTGPDGRRFYDERFSLRNVKVLVEQGSFRPQNGWYPSLSYLPQAALLGASQSLYRLTGTEGLNIFRRDGGFTPSAYRLARSVSVLAGAGSLLLTFLIGRRLFSPEVALLGTFLLAVCPWLIRSFVVFKPDALLVFFCLLAFYWALDAAEEPFWTRFVLAGLGVGLAAATKYNGALIAIPLIVMTLLAYRQWRRMLPRLVVAGVTSIAVFVLLNPYLTFYWSYFRRLSGIYATRETNNPLEMLLAEGRMLLHWSFHGWLVGTVALVGLTALVVLLSRRRDGEPHPRRLAMFLSVPLGYSLVYALAMNLPKGNNYLLILPFTSLAAAWLLHRLWGWISQRLTPTARRLAFWPAFLGFLAFVAWPAGAFVYTESATATTLGEVGRLIQRERIFLAQRKAVFESDLGVPYAADRTHTHHVWMATVEVSALSELPEQTLDRADFEIFREDRLHGPNRDFYLRRMLRLGPGQVAIAQPQLFRRRGTSQVVLFHRWYPVGAAVGIEWKARRPRKGNFRGRIPREVVRGEVVSLDLTLPRGESGPEQLLVGDLALEPIAIGWNEEGERFMTPRFQVPGGDRRVRFRYGERWEHPEPPRLTVWRWSSTPPPRG